MSRRARLALEPALRARLARDLKAHLEVEHGVDVGGLGAELLLDFLAERLGPALYNLALRDAETALRARLDDLLQALPDLELPER